MQQIQDAFMFSLGRPENGYRCRFSPQPKPGSWLYFNIFCTAPHPSIPAYSWVVLGPVKQSWFLFAWFSGIWVCRVFLFLGAFCWFCFLWVFLIIYLNGTICGIPQGVKHHSNKRRRIPQTFIFVAFLSPGDLPVSSGYSVWLLNQPLWQAGSYLCVRLCCSLGLGCSVLPCTHCPEGNPCAQSAALQGLGRCQMKKVSGSY